MFPKRTVFSALVIFFGLTVSMNSASAQNVLGARILGMSDQSVHAVGGFPDFEIGYHMPWSERIELIPTARFAYGRDAKIDQTQLQAGLEMRYRIPTPESWGKWQRKIHFSIRLAVPLQWSPSSPGTWGLGILWPGVGVTYRHTDKLDINLFVQLQDTIRIGTDAPINLFVDLGVGVEYQLTRQIGLLAQLELGPDIYFGQGTEFQVRAVAGVSYGF